MVFVQWRQTHSYLFRQCLAGALQLVQRLGHFIIIVGQPRHMLAHNDLLVAVDADLGIVGGTADLELRSVQTDVGQRG